MRLTPYSALALAGAALAMPAVAQESYIDSASRTVVRVETNKPLPSEQTVTAPRSTPITGTSTGAGYSSAFTPQLGRPIWISLSVTSWPGGTAQLFRSLDGGGTKLPYVTAGVTLNTYTGSGYDVLIGETDPAATYYLYLPGAGITYKVSN